EGLRLWVEPHAAVVAVRQKRPHRAVHVDAEREVRRRGLLRRARRLAGVDRGPEARIERDHAPRCLDLHAVEDTFDGRMAIALDLNAKRRAAPYNGGSVRRDLEAGAGVDQPLHPIPDRAALEVKPDVAHTAG